MMRYLLINNVAKPTNIRALVSAAGAFGFECLRVDKRAVAEDGEPVSELVHVPEVCMCVRVHLFRSLAACSTWLRARNVRIVGIELAASAVDAGAYPWVASQSVALLPGNEGIGLTERQKSECDDFVYIPQYGSGTASLNVVVATSLVLYQYHQAHSETH
jgi:tRNA G18 (ribose-2'-O)-methylase SpoU